VSAAERALVFECGGEQLLGILHPAQTPAAAQYGIVIVVGGPQYRAGSHRQFTLMARSFAQAGYPVLRFDYRGMGDSGGAARAFDQVDEDIAAAIDLLCREAGVQQVVLWGLCDAASACMIYCSRNDTRVRGLIVANPWVRTASGEAQAYLKHYYLRRFLQKSFWRKVLGGGFDVRQSLRGLLAVVKQSSRADSADANNKNTQGASGVAPTDFIGRMLKGWQTFAGPVMVLISERDLTAREFVEHCAKSPAWRRQLAGPRTARHDCAGADHTFSAAGDLSAASRRCLEWLRDSASADRR
jgi:uncharacterized protein